MLYFIRELAETALWYSQWQQNCLDTRFRCNDNVH